MTKKRKTLEATGQCRFCMLDNGPSTSLFDEEIQSKLIDLSKCTSIDIKDEQGLPNIVCYACMYKLDMMCEFKNQVIRSHQMLSQVKKKQDDIEYLPELKKIHKDVEQAGDDSLSDSSLKKRAKRSPPLLAHMDTTNADDTRDQAMLKDMYISDNDGTSSKDSSKAPDDKNKKDEKQDNKNSGSLKSNSIAKTKSLTSTGRRNMMERRKASTKRWVARKRALLAARGESASDTDSTGSGSTELSPVQKARAKTNLDKEVEKQKQLLRTLKNSDPSSADKYTIQNDVIVIDSDSEVHRTRSLRNSDTPLYEIKSAALIKSKRSKGKKNEKKEYPLKPLPEKIAKEKSKDDRTIAIQDEFVPCFTKSEVEVGDTKYIITSTLTPTEPYYLNKENLNALSKEIKNGSIEPSQEKNTDIIDAVQLRRINPIPTDAEKKCVEKCLSILIEGSESLPLRRVQLELAVFVQKEMKQRLFGVMNDLKKDNASETLFEALNRQLKIIVEKAIKNNFENSVLKNCGINFKSLADQSSTVSPDFVKAALRSAKYQPKIVLKRLNIAKESKQFNINNVHAAFKRTVKSRLGGPFSMVSHKRQSVPPIRYNDYNTSPLDSDSYFSDESDASKSENRQRMLDPRMQGKREEESRADFSDARNEQKSEIPDSVFNVTLSGGEKHGCGVCDQSFDSRAEAIEHVRIHKAEAGSRPNKQKMMRCKRCQEVVEARFVKAHVCKSTRQLVHKCFVCNSTFRTEKFLAQHLESHDQSEFTVDNVTKGEPQKLNASKSDVVQFPKDDSRLETVDPELEITVVKDVPELERPKETYTCFVCDKIFTDEEVLKDHLQKHCDDMSEGNESPDKEQYECAICGESLETEDALETHVEKHLYEEEDDNPNLINITHESKSRSELYQCIQCTEAFNSEMLLEMHMQAHEEEAAIAEWEKQGIRTYRFQCLICEELFETDEDLSEHLDIHNANAHVCQLCDKPFMTLEDLQQHVATH